MAYWHDPQINVPKMREEAREEIKRRVASGELRWDRESIEKVTLAWGPAGAGAYIKPGREDLEEGREMEAAPEPNEVFELDEAHCETDEEIAAEKRFRATQIAKQTSSSGVPASSSGAPVGAELEPYEISGVLVPADADDQEEDQAEARRFGEQMELLDGLLRQIKLRT